MLNSFNRKKAKD